VDNNDNRRPLPRSSDIEAAHETCARALGVATGESGVAQLRDAGADAVGADLTDTSRLVEMIRDGVEVAAP
jgi:hypothetical protein